MSTNNMSELLTQPDEITTQSFRDVGINQTSTPKQYSPTTYLVIVQILVGSFSIFGNLIIVRVLYDLPNSKLRKTTKLLLNYVAISHCILSTVLVLRLFRLPCTLFLIGAYISGFNALSGMLYLAYEALIMVTKPHTHPRYVSMNICRLGILVSCLVSGFISLAAYITKSPSNYSFCYFNNGIISPLLLFSIFSLVFAMILFTSTIQICTLRIMKKTFPTGSVSASNSISMNQIAPVPVITQPNQDVLNISQSPLQRLIKILAASLLCFVICWCPIISLIMILSVYDKFEKEIDPDLRRQLATILSGLTMLNGGLHAVVYLVMSTQIRQAVKKYIRSWLCFCKSN